MSQLVWCTCTKCKGGKAITKNLSKYHLGAMSKEASVSRPRPSEKPDAFKFDGPSLHSSAVNSSISWSDLHIDFGPGPSALAGLPTLSAIESDMLARGTLTRQDLNLQLYGSQLPDLGPNFDCAEDLLANVQLHEILNPARASTAHPLTSYEAHRDPFSKEDRRFVRQFQEMYESEQEIAQNQDTTMADEVHVPAGGATEAYWQPDYELDFEDIDDLGELDLEGADDEDGEAPQDLPPPNLTEEDPLDKDPFAPQELPSPGADGDDSLADLPAHLVCIYSLVTWLHLQFHLPRIACNVVLAAFACLLSFVAPELEEPYITLKSANRALSLDAPVHILPVCATCKEVYPASSETQDTCKHCDTTLFLSDLTRRGRKREGRIPSFKYPYLSLSEQLPAVLATPGIEDALDAWRGRVRTPGMYEDIFDGEVCRGLRGYDKLPFFSNGPDEHRGPKGELRIGLTMGVDWFSYIRSNIAPSHSSCPTSFSICNLPPEYRYRTSNLLLTSILPGPKEQTGDEIQRFLRPIVSDLIRLWKDGIKVATPSCPNGRRVRVILVAVVCDKPAAHKLGGFGSHSHTLFCTRCWIKQNAKLSQACFEPNAFSPRTNEEHRALGEQYRLLKTETLRKNFATKNATRYTEFSRLPYFNIIDQIVIDPMHNLFLGLVKGHFYHIWVQGKVLRENHELRRLHEMLNDFTVPTSLGKLPKDIGIPAGGSLTADQWLLLATVYGPIVVPQLWASYLPDGGDTTLDARKTAIDNIAKAKAAKQAKAAAARAAKKQDKEKQKQQAPATKKRRKEPEESGSNAEAGPSSGPPLNSPADNQPTQNDAPSISPDATEPTDAAINVAFSLHRDDPSNFLKLSAALKLIIKRTLSVNDLVRADSLLRDYCKELLTLYGPSVIRPNHHYAMHTIDFIRNFGPVHGFWTFVFERLNKVLKGFKANNHAGGELETTFFQEFQRTCQSSRVLYRLARYKEDSMEEKFSKLMTRATQEERGTVASLAAKFVEENDVVDPDAGVSYSLSPRHACQPMSSELYRVLLRQLNFVRHYHGMTERPKYEDSIPLSDKATFFDYVLINGMRYQASSTKGVSAQTLIQAQFYDARGNLHRECGELMEIFRFDDFTGRPGVLFGHVRWLIPKLGFHGPLWTQFFEEMDVRLWELHEYHEVDTGVMPPLIDLAWITGHVARSVVKVGTDKVWATVPIQRMSQSR